MEKFDEKVKEYGDNSTAALSYWNKYSKQVKKCKKIYVLKAVMDIIKQTKK